MKTKTCRFVRAVVRSDDFPEDGKPEIVFMGRSNVGKSSLINKVLGRHGMARVSKTPGRTREVHYYLIDEQFYLVDLPGFGYAKVSQAMRRQWGKLVEAYLSRKTAIHLAVHLVDSRHDPTTLDAMLRDALLSRGLPTVVALTKSDKLSGSKIPRAVSQARQQLELPDDVSVIATSSKSGVGMAALGRVLEDALASNPGSPG